MANTDKNSAGFGNMMRVYSETQNEHQLLQLQKTVALFGFIGVLTALVVTVAVPVALVVWMFS